MFKKILICNRGEIAVRIIRTCKDMGIRTAVVYSDTDSDSLHVRLADEAYRMPLANGRPSYLDMEKILEIARASETEAIHPGYGFLAENPDFVEMSEQQGITMIGPPSRCISQIKPKYKSRQLMKSLDIPIVPGSDEPLMNIQPDKLTAVEEVVESIGYPVVLKPSGGGGGIGIVLVKNREELGKAVQSVEEIGKRVFGVPSFYVEKFFPGIKHIEFQILADQHNNVVHLGERDCSIQRRFQKLIEESPCHILSSHLRMKMAVAALDVAVALKYVNALTVEFFYVPHTQEFYFNEVNCRLQVEHCITEIVTGIDIVREQIRIAAGERLGFTQDDVTRKGCALECRITAEDAARNFLPSPGVITVLRLPHGLGLRIDEGVYEGYDVPIYYDPLLLKLMTWGTTRSETISRMKRALSEMTIEGIKTNIPFHKLALENEDFNSGYYVTDFVTRQGIIPRLRQKASLRQ